MTATCLAKSAEPQLHNEFPQRLPDPAACPTLRDARDGLLLAIMTILFLFGRITEPIASGAMSIITGAITAFYWSRLKDQRELMNQKLKTSKILWGHKLTKGMLYAKMPSKEIAGLLRSETSTV